MWVLGLNSGPYACKVTALPAEPLPSDEISGILKVGSYLVLILINSKLMSKGLEQFLTHMLVIHAAFSPKTSLDLLIFKCVILLSYANYSYILEKFICYMPIFSVQDTYFSLLFFFSSKVKEGFLF